jgi:hypothetical protein
MSDPAIVLLNIVLTRPCTVVCRVNYIEAKRQASPLIQRARHDAGPSQAHPVREPRRTGAAPDRLLAATEPSHHYRRGKWTNISRKSKKAEKPFMSLGERQKQFCPLGEFG